jgi:hypothetical protein
MTAIVNSDMRFKVAIHNYGTKVFDLTDVWGTTGWNTKTGGTPLASTTQVGIVKGVNPSGTVFYGGNAYSGNDFTVPDITTTGWAKTGMTLPSILSFGNYTFYYKTRILIGQYGGIGGSNYDLSTCSSDVVTILSCDYTTIFGTTPVGMSLQILNGSTYHTEPITSISTNLTDTTITATGMGTLTLGAGDKVYMIMENNKSYNYNITTPVMSISAESWCSTSQLTATDSTDYSITDYAGNLILPTVTTRTWTIIYPDSILPTVTGSENPITIGYGSSYNAGAYIYTGEYDISLVTVCYYDMGSWDLCYIGGNFYWMEVYTYGSADTTCDVVCDTCLCTLVTCIATVRTYYLAALGDDLTEAQRLKSILDRMVLTAQLYFIYERCGKDPAVLCEDLKTLTDLADCTCNTVATRGVNPVVPYSQMGAGVSGGGNKITTQSGLSPFPTAPNAGDIVILSDSLGGYVIGAYYTYSGSAWVYQFNLIPAAPTATNPMLADNWTGYADIANTNAQKLATYTLAAGKMATNGDMLYVEASYTIIDTIDFKETGIYLAGVSVNSEANVASGTTKITVWAKVTRISATTSKVESGTIYQGTPDSSITKAVASVSYTFSGTIDIDFYSRKNAAGAPADITLTNYKVIYYKI